jgi:HAMP domain-containing protein/putative methionine-R-sulfoxide reductase with GAF domain
MKTKIINASLRNRLLGAGLGIAIILLVIGLITNKYIKEIFDQYETVRTLDKIDKSRLDIIHYEQSILIKEVVNPRFYQTASSKYAKYIKDEISCVYTYLDSLKENKIIYDLELKEPLGNIRNTFQQYSNQLHNMIRLTLEKGFKDYGLIGDMRNQIHLVESMVATQDKLELTALMLSLRRSEKDYLLRRDIKYKQKFVSNTETFINKLKNTSFKNKEDGERLKNAIIEYRNLFFEVINKDNQIGLVGTNGVLQEMTGSLNKIETELSAITPLISKHVSKRINRAVGLLFIILTMLSLGILIILFVNTRYIIRSINNIKSYINRLGQGEIPEKIHAKHNDEIGEISLSINSLIESMKKNINFAVNVGNGNFEIDLESVSQKGELETKLIEMRDKLRQAEKERQKQQIEAKERIWANEGISQFTDIMNKHNSNIKELCYKVISYLIKYIEANLGGIYLINEADENDIFYELAASYAYDRRKYLDVKIYPGENLVGTCAIEKEPVYMTDLPNDYINISTGMGSTTSKSLIIVPMIIERKVIGLFEIASREEIPQYKREFIKRIATDLATNLNATKSNITTNELLKKSQEQAEALKSQEEEMRQNLEELSATQEQMEIKEQELKSCIQQLTEEKANLEQKLQANGYPSN